MRLHSHLRDLALRVAQHEMGHYVVGTALGFRTGDVTLEIIGPTNEHRGAASIELAMQIESLSDVASYLERRVQVLYAGAAAETLKIQSPNNLVDQQTACDLLERPGLGAEQDYAKSRELVHLLRDIRHPHTNCADADAIERELTTISEELWVKSVALVEKHAKIICGLASNLAGKVKKVRSEVRLQKHEIEELPAIKEFMLKLDSQS